MSFAVSWHHNAYSMGLISSNCEQVDELEKQLSLLCLNRYTENDRRVDKLVIPA